ncbi:hypothetical protein DSO57_1036865 [Entomophthora muscae]|uniref:Uncharacterized protein n=1 Tax=Entomophthora muscae TaxID=34485 RepID=A0ACC2TL94_9FUNG|nr:hypothetical protein DSO57_1036865 [Entomophthora muscae]
MVMPEVATGIPPLESRDGVDLSRDKISCTKGLRSLELTCMMELGDGKFPATWGMITGKDSLTGEGLG